MKRQNLRKQKMDFIITVPFTRCRDFLLTNVLQSTSYPPVPRRYRLSRRNRVNWCTDRPVVKYPVTYCRSLSVQVRRIRYFCV